MKQSSMNNARALKRRLVRSDRMAQMKYDSLGMEKRAFLAIMLLKRFRFDKTSTRDLCLVVHHGGNRHEIRAACAIGLRSKALDTLLRHQMIDRCMIMKNKHQIHGTQYRSNQQGDILEPFPILKRREALDISVSRSKNSR